MKNALNNQVGMLGDMFLWLVANLKQGVIYFIKQALPPNKSAGSVQKLGIVGLYNFKGCVKFTHIIPLKVATLNTTDKRIGRIYYFILYVLISLINSANSIIRSKWTLTKQPRVEMGFLSTLSVWSFNIMRKSELK